MVGASVVYFAGRTYQKSVKEKEEEEEEEGTLARVDELPSWVYFPDVERAEWLNKVLLQFSVFISLINLIIFNYLFFYKLIRFY